LLLAALTLACNSQPATCDALPLPADTTEQLATASTAVGFASQLPCAYRDDLEVIASSTTALAPPPVSTSLSGVAVSGATNASTSSARPAPKFPSRHPPQLHNIAVTATTAAGDSVTASGFAGPTAAEVGGGDTIAYLRWHANGITHELAAILTLWFDEPDALQTAAALIATLWSEDCPASDARRLSEVNRSLLAQPRTTDRRAHPDVRFFAVVSDDRTNRDDMAQRYRKFLERVVDLKVARLSELRSEFGLQAQAAV